MDQRGPLTLEDFEKAAEILGCDREAIEAVAQIEAPGTGFFPNNEPRTLFEGHKFYKYTNGGFAGSHPTLCYQRWTKKFYGKTWEEEYIRFVTATTLDVLSALLSTSFGRFQIMGFNYQSCGFESVHQFYAAMKINEQEHLKAFIYLLKSWGLDLALSHRDWRTFAKRYNGPAYEENNYHVKLEEAYNTYKNYQS
jgi:hypothetical protein